MRAERATIGALGMSDSLARAPSTADAGDEGLTRSSRHNADSISPRTVASLLPSVRWQWKVLPPVRWQWKVLEPLRQRQKVLQPLRQRQKVSAAPWCRRACIALLVGLCLVASCFIAESTLLAPGEGMKRNLAVKLWWKGRKLWMRRHQAFMDYLDPSSQPDLAMQPAALVRAAHRQFKGGRVRWTSLLPRSALH